MAWVKPYLKNIQRLQMDQTKMKTPDLLVAFETSIIEVEILAKKPKTVKLTKSTKTLNQVILLHFLFRTRPEMTYQQEGYQRGPLHVGRVITTYRAYVWDDKQIENYKKMREIEDFKLLGLVDASVKAAMEALGDELMKYLAEAGEEILPKEKVPHPPKLSYSSIFSGFRSIFQKMPTIAPKKLTKTDAMLISSAKSDAVADVKKSMWGIYHHFKKHHAMLNW